MIVRDSTFIPIGVLILVSAMAYRKVKHINKDLNSLYENEYEQGRI